MSLAIVLVSGGLDSCVAAATAALDHELAFLHLNYRQRTQERELRAFAAIADHYQVEPASGSGRLLHAADRRYQPD